MIVGEYLNSIRLGKASEHTDATKCSLHAMTSFHQVSSVWKPVQESMISVQESGRTFSSPWVPQILSLSTCFHSSEETLISARMDDEIHSRFDKLNFASRSSPFMQIIPIRNSTA